MYIYIYVNVSSFYGPGGITSTIVPIIVPMKMITTHTRVCSVVVCVCVVVVCVCACV